MRDAEITPSQSAETLERITREHSTQSLAGPALQQQLGETAASANLTHYFGSIAFVGRTSNGDRNVQFNDENANTGYSSVWPDWAFEMAQAAMLNAKKVLVLADGIPTGANLVQILVFA
jgi:hypothetical protein